MVAFGPIPVPWLTGRAMKRTFGSRGVQTSAEREAGLIAVL